jgi:hypothetical protein
VCHRGGEHERRHGKCQPRRPRHDLRSIDWSYR